MSLDEKGYIVVHNVLSELELAKFRVRLDEIYDEEGAQAGWELTQEVGCRRLTNLVNKDPIFDVCFTNPVVLAATLHALGDDFTTNSLNFRDPMGGYGLQRLHPDYEKGVEPGTYLKVNAVWLIDEQNSNNGATRLVPGSHLSGKHPRDCMRNHHDRHPQEIQCVYPAGTVVVFNAHVWHGGTCNISGQHRRTLHASYIKRGYPQQLNEREHILTSTLDRISIELKTLMDL